MTFDTVKEKLHDYIDHADQNKVMAIYTLLGAEIEPPALYDEDMLNSLEATRDAMLSGKEKTYTLEETITNIRKHRGHDL